MRLVALEYTYHTDIIEVPDSIACRIKKVQNSFDKWLYDRSSRHNCWVTMNGKKKAVSFDSQDFVDFINTCILCEHPENAKVVQINLKRTPEDIPVLYF